MIKRLFFVCLVFAASSHLDAAVKLSPLFADHMVLQRERPVPVWGVANPNEKVSVTFGQETQVTKAGQDGKWMIFLAPMSANKAPQILKVQGENQIEVTDVLVGDVWLGTGQSNMDWSLSATDRSAEIKQIPQSAWAGIRMFKVNQAEADQPVADLTGKWLEPTAPNIMGFSATLFYFGEELHKRQPEVPLGLVRSSVGATNLYCWVPNEVRDSDPSAEFLRNWWAKANQSWTPEKQAQRDQEMADYLAKVEEYKQRNENLPSDVKKPGELVGPKWSRRPSALYNGMIAPLQPLAIRGMIWYQGEWDAKRDWSQGYHGLFLAFAKSWRSNWVAASGKKQSGEFPIYVVQLPAREPGDGDYWPYLREVEAKLGADVPNAGYIVTFDTNDPKELHPKAKTPVGQRLAWLALAKEYGQKIAWHGPELQSAKPEPNGLLLQFDAGAKSLKSADGQPLRHFELAAADGVYHLAQGEIRGENSVFVSSAEVAQPKTVRYAFAPAPERPNFINADGLPAGPFRTDNQPIPAPVGGK